MAKSLTAGIGVELKAVMPAHAGIQERGGGYEPACIPASETVDFLRVGVAAALVAAVRDEPKRGQAPRLRVMSPPLFDSLFPGNDG